MNHPSVIQLREHAKYGPDKMGKNTIYASNRVLVGLNAFEPGQEHALHAHAAMDKIYHVLEGSGQFLLEGESLPMREGEMLVAPADVAHGIRNDSSTASVTTRAGVCWSWPCSLPHRSWSHPRQRRGREGGGGRG
jgi:quercetin dioxygenase-like cupin family protein